MWHVEHPGLRSADLGPRCTGDRLVSERLRAVGFALGTPTHRQNSSIAPKTADGRPKFARLPTTWLPCATPKEFALRLTCVVTNARQQSGRRAKTETRQAPHDPRLFY